MPTYVLLIIVSVSTLFMLALAAIVVESIEHD